MAPDTTLSPVTSDSPTSPTRRSLLSLLGLGTLAGGLASLAAQKSTDARRKKKGGLPPLSRQSQLDSAAVAHSQDMATRCFFDHINPDGADPGDRIAATGYQASAWAENIYKGSGSLGSAVEAFNAWETSTKGHRENMLSTAVTQIGIGAALDSDGFVIWTNVFGKPAT